jgi:hypothetical protein
MKYGLNSPLPPVGTRVEHEQHGPGVIVMDHASLGQWAVRFDRPVTLVEGGPTAWSLWLYPYTLSPAVGEAEPRPFDLAAIIDGMGDLDPRLVRTEIAMRLIRLAAAALAGTEYTVAFRLLEEAKAVLGPASNGINGAGVGYAVEYVNRFLDKLAVGAPR